MGLISEELNNMLNDVLTKCFALNRLLDRDMSLLSVKFKMARTAEILHPALAHAYLGDEFADSISEYQASRDMLTIYGATPIGNKDYNTPLDLIVDYYNENLELQEMIYDTVDKAIEVGDYTTKIVLDGLLSRLSKYTALSITLVDLFTDYGSEPYKLQLLDSVIDKYVTV